MTFALMFAITTLFVIPAGVRCYEYPRKALFVTFALPLISWCFARDVYLNYPGEVLTCLFIMIGWWFVRSALSEDSRTAVSHSFLFTMSAVGALTIVSVLSIQTVFLIMVMAAYANAIIAILQHFGISLVPKEMRGKHLIVRTALGKIVYGENGRSKKNHRYPAFGMIGNTNFLGIYLAISLFMCAWLIEHISLLYFIPAVVIVVAMVMARCRVALFAVVVGLVSSWSLVAGFLMLAVALWRAWDVVTFKFRRRYLREAVLQLKRTPIMGVGFDVYKKFIPLRRKEIKDKDSDHFDGYKKIPPVKCHNDYIQHILDNGLIGFVLYYTVVVMALLNADGMILSGLIAMLIIGLGMHSFHLFPVNLFSWVLVFAALKGGQFYVPGGVIPVVCLMLVPLLKNPLETLLGDIMLRKGLCENPEFLKVAEKIDPQSSDIVMHRSIQDYTDGKHFDAFEKTMRLIYNFDGTHVLNNYYMNAGGLLQLLEKDANDYLRKSDEYEWC